ncbi:MAG: chromate resistance protein ChrB domain-containing protein [Vicinamibacteria bacterium]
MPSWPSPVGGTPRHKDRDVRDGPESRAVQLAWQLGHRMIQLCYGPIVAASFDVRWLLLIHQIPPNPSYLRVKVGRRLQGLGAVPVKNSVYVLPQGDQALEDFQWVRQEIVAGGGDAFVCEARFVEGLSDAGIEALFIAARQADYDQLEAEAHELQAGLAARGKRASAARAQADGVLLRLRRKLEGVHRIDFFSTPGREAIERLVDSIEDSLRPPTAPETEAGDHGNVRGRTWVTRTGVQIDRIASAWLIRKFIDKDARFRFTRGDEAIGADELRFDMFEAEFTHEGDQCTFEVLLRRFGLTDRALRHVGEIVHDVDLKDGKFGREEAAGIGQLIAGVSMRHADDQARLRDGAAIFDSLYAFSTGQPGRRPRP